MRPTLFRSDVLRRHLLQAKMATLGELKRALRTQVDLTVFRKLKQLDYLTSYSHRARYYTLRQIARFDADGLWSYDAVWFSGHGTLLATAEAWVQHSPQGYFAEELAECLNLATHTVARGPQQLLDQEVTFARVRKIGGGRQRAEKKTPK